MSAPDLTVFQHQKWCVGIRISQKSDVGISQKSDDPSICLLSEVVDINEITNLRHSDRCLEDIWDKMVDAGLVEHEEELSVVWKDLAQARKDFNK